MNLNLKNLFRAKNPKEIEKIIEFGQSLAKNLKELEKIETQYRSFEYDLSQSQQYNPNPLVYRKTMNIFDEMYHKDEQVKACHLIKKQLILSTGFNIEIQDQNDEQQKKIKDFLIYALDDGYDGFFINDLFKMLSAIQFGFSLTEKVWKMYKSGPYKGFVGCELLTRPPHSFEFYLSDGGDLEQIKQQCQKKKIEIPEDKVIIYTFDQQFQNPYGTSDFTAIYQTYFMKLQLKKYMAIYSERAAITPLFAKYSGQLSEKLRKTIFNMLISLQAKSIAIFPDNVNIESLNMEKASSVDLFVKYFDQYNSTIARGQLLPELAGFTVHNTGSQSLGIEQFDLFMKVAIFSVQTILEDIIQEKQIKKLVDYNFGEQKSYPKFKFNKPEPREKLEMYKVWVDAAGKRVVKNTIEDEATIRREFGFSERKEDVAAPVGGKKIKGGLGNDNDNAGNMDNDINSDNNDRYHGKEFIAAAEGNIKYRRKLTEFEEKNADIDNIVNSFEKLEIKFANNFSVVVNDIRLYLEKKVIDEKIITEKNFKAVNNLTLQKKQSNGLKVVFGKGLEDAFNRAIQDTKINIKKASKTAPEEFRYTLVEMAEGLQYTVGSLKPKEAITYLNNKKILLAGTEETYILKKAKQIIEGGLSYGKTESVVIAEMEEFFNTYNARGNPINISDIPGRLSALLRDYPHGGKPTLDNINDISGRLSTVVRTITAEAYNRGNFQVYNDPNIKPIIGALQYSSIIDDNTTDFCISYDGRIFNANDSVWDWLIPPNHFDCRSTTILIFTFNSYAQSKKIAVRPASGFGGAA